MRGSASGTTRGSLSGSPRGSACGRVSASGQTRGSPPRKEHSLEPPAVPSPVRRPPRRAASDLGLIKEVVLHNPFAAQRRASVALPTVDEGGLPVAGPPTASGVHCSELGSVFMHASSMDVSSALRSSQHVRGSRPSGQGPSHGATRSGPHARSSRPSRSSHGGTRTSRRHPMAMLPATKFAGGGARGAGGSGSVSASFAGLLQAHSEHGLAAKRGSMGSRDGGEGGSVEGSFGLGHTSGHGACGHACHASIAVQAFACTGRVAPTCTAQIVLHVIAANVHPSGPMAARAWTRCGTCRRHILVRPPAAQQRDRRVPAAVPAGRHGRHREAPLLDRPRTAPGPGAHLAPWGRRRLAREPPPRQLCSR